AAAASPSIASSSSHAISGFSGLPKLRQSVSARGSPPAQATLRAASSTADIPAARGSSRATGPGPSSETARPRMLGRRRSTAASRPGRRTVREPTRWSYCSYTRRFEARLGERRSARSASCGESDTLTAVGSGRGRGRAVARHLRERGGEPRGATVLERLDEAALDELDGGLDELLAGERVADLHRRPLLVGAFAELLAREHAGAANSVAAGRGAEEQDEVPRPARPRARHPLAGQEADAHRVDEAVVGVGRVEDTLAANRRDADRVAVR